MRLLKITFSTLLIALILFPSISCGSKEKPAVEEEIPIEITADSLYTEYEENEVAADLQYKGKLLRVSGRIYTFGKTSATDIMAIATYSGTTKGVATYLDVPYVVLNGGKSGTPTPGLDIWGTQCVFPQGSAPAVAKLSKGQEIVIEGRCIGGNRRFVTLIDCYLVLVK